MTTMLKKVLLTAYLVLTCIALVEDHHDEGHDHNHKNLLTESQIWGFGFLSGFAVSLIGFLTSLLIVYCKKMASDACFQIVIKTLFSLGFGALIGDATVHILPQAYKTQGSQSGVVAIIFIGAIVFFLILERAFAAFGVTHSHWHGEECHDDHKGAIEKHNHPNRVRPDDPDYFTKNGDSNSHLQASNIVSKSIGNNASEDKNDSKKKDRQLNPETEQQEEKEKGCLQNLKGKGSAGYMNLIGSLIHNFLDGLAIGVAFSTGDKDVFVPILVTIIAHEIPRQMGDVAILMTNQFNGIQTILCNGIINLISIVGVLIGLGITSLSQVAKAYVMVFVAGNFMYIAADIWKNLFKNSSAFRNCCEFVGMSTGVGVMYLLILLQSDEHGHSH